jgi:hypothetical protein
MTHKSTLQGHIHRLKSPLLVDRKKQALGKEIKRLNSLVFYTYLQHFLLRHNACIHTDEKSAIHLRCVHTLFYLTTWSVSSA